MGKRKRNPVGEGSLMDERKVHCSMESDMKFRHSLRPHRRKLCLYRRKLCPYRRKLRLKIISVTGALFFKLKNVFSCHALESYNIASMSFASFSGLVMGA